MASTASLLKQPFLTITSEIGKAFRHGDIESILSELAKTAGHSVGGGGLIGFAQSVLSAASGGAKFSKEDVKRVYFGNWLRDYSQAMDIAGLSKLTGDTIVLIVGVLGFLTFGFATEEYQVTPDRLGVYLPVEHIDNPKGYAEKEGDAREFHPKLRPPVNPEELEIDRRTGMKNYMATENRGWDTSTAHIRRTLQKCIEHGRRARGQEGADLWEAYRLLGTGLHTLEDLLAHSNWCEIALRKLGHRDVFCHVGDNVTVNTPNGPAPPLVTGTFGSADFIHSLMGEATDHLSQASVVDLSKQMNSASSSDENSFGNLKDILGKLPIGGGSEDDKMNQADEMKAKAKAYEFNPDDVAPPEVQEQLLSLLKWRDDIYREVLKKIEAIPGLEDLIEALTNALNAYVYTIIAPYLTPILQQVTSVLGEGSKAVIDSDDQYEVFNNPNASDPSHSLLSKDHFALILNEPAGKIAQIVVQYSVNLIVEAWFDDNSDPNRIIDQILESFHHPYYANGSSRIQQMMFEGLEKWIGGLGPEEAEKTLQALTKESVREGKNKRLGSDDDMAQSSQVFGCGHSHGAGSQGYGGSSQAGYQSQSQSQSYGRSSGGGNQTQGTYGSSAQQYGSSGGYGSSQTEYNSESAGEYGRSQASSYGRQTSDTYGASGGYASRRDDSDSYSSARRQENQYEPSTTAGYGSGGYGSSGRTEGYSSSDTYDTNRTEGFGSGGGGYNSNTRAESYGSEERHPRRQHHGEEESRGSSYSSGGYGGGAQKSHEDTYSSRRQEESGYGGSGGYGSSRSEFVRTGGDEYGSSRRERNEYESPGHGREEREREREGGYGGSSYGRDESSGYSRQQPAYGGDSGGYGRSEDTPSYGEGRRYGGESAYESREEGGRGGYGGHSGYGGESRRPEHTSGEHQSRHHRGNDDDNNTSSYGGGGYGGQGYRAGGGYGGRDETFGAEKLNLGSDSDNEDRHNKHKKHHRRKSEDSE
ncbi:hypothetical protein QCA50_010186 [Cerrena zonata]|uniref:Het-C-domain-containing protein n=1 Tax=Cerrena zonata TaxID=2478898 RepID=A0AAW0FZZ8_9APHY